MNLASALRFVSFAFLVGGLLGTVIALDSGLETSEAIALGFGSVVSSLILLTLASSVEDVRRIADNTEGRELTKVPKTPLEVPSQRMPATQPVTSGRVCETCGASNIPGAKYCRACGQPVA